MSTNWRLAVSFAVVAALAATSARADHTGPLVEPTRHEGNFVSLDDQQICFDIWALTGSNPVTGDLVGFKVDPPADFSDAYVSIDLSDDGKSLGWSSTGATVLGVIVKGGPAFNLYDYHGANVVTDHDNGLVSPLNKKGALPQVSHYNVCYLPDEEDREAEGCTPGYWRNHADRWVGVAPGDDFDATFGVDLFATNITLGTAVSLGGGGNNALARHATAALLNAYGGVPNTSNDATVDYAYTVAQVIQMVQDAETNGTEESTKDLFAAANEAGCPLSGTSAVPVP